MQSANNPAQVQTDEIKSIEDMNSQSHKTREEPTEP